MRVALLVPFGFADPARLAAWRFVRSYYLDHHPGLRIVVGTPKNFAHERRWSKGAALANAAERLGNEDVVIVADADSIVLPRQLSEAVEQVRDGEAWIRPFSYVKRLDERTTATLIATNEMPRRVRVDRAPYRGIVGGGMIVASRAVFDDVPLDPRFRGWGGEDEAWGLALTCLHGAAEQLPGDLIHLWHPHPAPGRKRPVEPESAALLDAYRKAKESPIRMRALIDGRPVPAKDALPYPVRFRALSRSGAHRNLRAAGVLVVFRDGFAETTDPEVAAALDRKPGVERV